MLNKRIQNNTTNAESYITPIDQYHTILYTYAHTHTHTIVMVAEITEWSYRHIPYTSKCHNQNITPILATYTGTWAEQTTTATTGYHVAIATHRRGTYRVLAHDV